MPRNIMIVPHGARSDRRYGLHEVPVLRRELGLNNGRVLSNHLVGLIGWIQSNKRWDILTSMWEGIADEISREGRPTSWRIPALLAEFRMQANQFQKVIDFFTPLLFCELDILNLKRLT